MSVRALTNTTVTSEKGPCHVVNRSTDIRRPPTAPQPAKRGSDISSNLRRRSAIPIGLLNAEIRNFGTAEVILDGREQAHAPAYTLAVGGSYRHSSGWNGRLDVSARDAFFFDYSHDQKSSAYELVNLRVGYDAEQWSAHGWVRNVFDEKYAVRGFYFGNEPPLFENQLYIRQGDSRLAGLTFELRF